MDQDSKHLSSQDEQKERPTLRMIKVLLLLLKQQRKSMLVRLKHTIKSTKGPVLLWLLAVFLWL